MKRESKILPPYMRKNQQKLEEGGMDDESDSGSDSGTDGQSTEDQSVQNSEPQLSQDPPAPVREYGRLSFQPECMDCKRRGDIVLCTAKFTRGPMVHYQCPTCKYRVKLPRPYRTRQQDGQVNVAARPEMNE